MIPGTWLRTATVLCLLGGTVACTRHTAPLAVAVGVDVPLAAPVLHEFTREHGIEVTMRPGDDGDVDVVWARTPGRVLELAARHAMAVVPGEGDYGRPVTMIDPDRHWIAVSAVARAFVYDPAVVSDSEAPTRIDQIALAAIATRLVTADPTHGDALWHAAALFEAGGEAETVALYAALLAHGGRIVADEAAVVATVLRGERAIGLTSSDRAFLAQEANPNLVVLIPDQEPGGRGTFVLPAVIGVTARAADNPAARRLVEYLLEAPLARRLALTADALLVLQDTAGVPAGLIGLGALRAMPTAYDRLAARLPAVRRALAKRPTPP